VVLALAAVALQMLRAEGGRLEAWPLLAPFLLLSLPAMAVVAALALLFETIPGLKGGAGNIVYFFVCSLALSIPRSRGSRGPTGAASARDPRHRDRGTRGIPGIEGRVQLQRGPAGRLLEHGDVPVVGPVVDPPDDPPSDSCGFPCRWAWR